MADTFFDEQSEQSQVKAEIISKYFWAWAKAIIGAQKRAPTQSGSERMVHELDTWRHKAGRPSGLFPACFKAVTSNRVG
jgi:hypothetical protein